MGFKVKEENYIKYKKVFEIIWRHQLISINPSLADASSPIMPTEVLNRWEDADKKLAIKGLNAGLRDVLTNIHHHQKATLEAMDADLIKNGLPGLQKLIALVRNHAQKAIKRGKIKNQKEYSILSEVMNDLDSGVSEEEVPIINNLLLEFEKSEAQKKNDR